MRSTGARLQMKELQTDKPPASRSHGRIPHHPRRGGSRGEQNPRRSGGGGVVPGPILGEDAHLGVVIRRDEFLGVGGELGRDGRDGGGGPRDGGLEGGALGGGVPGEVFVCGGLELDDVGGVGFVVGDGGLIGGPGGGLGSVLG